MNLNQLAGKTANYLSGELALDNSKIDTLRFGLEIIFGVLFKGIILISLAHFFGILPEVTFALVSGAIYRILSGGAHCNGYWRCLLLGLFIYLGVGALALFAEPYLSIDLMVYLLLAGYSLSLICIILWAPGEVPFKRIANISERIMFKFLSLVHLSLWLGISIIVLLYSSSSLAFAGLIAVITQTISFSPPGYKVIHKIDYFLEGLFKERRCQANDAAR